ncbi:solute carrier organic anion transporter family member 74D isoform X2 [Procambarus clarkii]|nr:solute carrier organic anion transporter family member 74D-like [Procambarus clarkii]
MTEKNGLVESEGKSNFPSKSDSSTRSSFFSNLRLFSKPSFLRQDEKKLKLTKEDIRQTRELIHTEDDENETLCGIGPFKPSWLQVLARKEVYLLVYCMVGLTQGMFFTYTVSTISTIEKRFKLTSKQTGTMLAGNDISQVILAMLLGYYGNYGHRPRWVGFGVLCAAVSCFVAAIPHFVYGPGQDAIDIVETSSGSVGDLLANVTGLAKKTKKTEVCFSGGNPEDEESCDALHGQSYVGPVVLLFISQFFVGIAISIFYSIGVTYLDDNINKKDYPIYYSVTLLLRILGPVLGYLVGGKCLSLWIDPSQSPNLTRKDPRWLGAWWLGYLFIGCGLVFCGLLLFLFPRKMPATLKREAKRALRQASKDDSRRGVEYFASLARTKKMEATPNLPNLKKALKRLFTNKLWVGNLFNTVVIILALSGYWNFKPKYLENQFRKSATEANYYTGMASFASVVLGTGMGGAIMRWVRPRPRYVAAYNIFVTLFLTAGFIILMFIGCPKLTVLGPVDGAPGPDCSVDCGCSDRFSPVCSQDLKTVFYSPCYAGCAVANTSVSPIMFSECRCISSNSSQLTGPFNTSSAPSSSSPPAEVDETLGFGRSGYCPEPCDTFFYYLVFQIIIKTISSTGRVGSSVLHLRSVADEDKGLALGTLTVFISFFGFIPAPIIMGAIIDSSCLVWDKSCGVYGNCWLYDSDKFRTIIHLVPAVFTFISVFGDLVVFHYSHQLDLYGDRDDDVEMERPEDTSKEDEVGEEEEESKPLNAHKDEDFNPPA